MDIIGICGNTGSGKDSIAEFILEDENFVRVSFADPIKRFCHEVFGFTYDQLWGVADKNKLDTKFSKDKQWDLAQERFYKKGPAWTAGLALHPSFESLEAWFLNLRNDHTSISPRIVCQSLGTEWGRHTIDEDLWICEFFNICSQLSKGHSYTTLHGVSSMKATYQGIVIPDVRFRNEVDAIKEAGGHLVRVFRPQTDTKADSIGLRNHQSETQQHEIPLYLFDCVIQNTGTLSELHQTVTSVLSCWRL